jgi:16S rRNA (cytosine1402-N4)-methyltransferase
MQLDRDYKGFSFSKEGPLDMRMNPTSSLKAEDIINTYSEKELGRIFKEYGEEPRWRHAAKAIVEARRKTPIISTKQLSDLLCKASGGRGRLHPATLVFQALRICVNKELDSLTEGLQKAIQWLAPRGRIGAISFHSLEDRIVKNIFRDAATPVRDGRVKLEPVMKLLTKKPLVPTLAEMRHNVRSRSAKMRFAEKIGGARG